MSKAMHKRSDACWRRVGVFGDRTCPELKTRFPCRNCPYFAEGAATMFSREMSVSYFEELTRSISEPPAAVCGAEKTALAFRVGAEWLALPAPVFAEFTKPCAIRAVPHRANSIFAGLASIRGEILLCFSLSALLGIPAGAESSSRRRFCVVLGLNRKWVFPADEVYGLFAYSAGDLQPLPVTVAKQAHKYAAGIVPVENRQAGLLDADRIFAAFERSLA